MDMKQLNNINNSYKVRKIMVQITLIICEGNNDSANNINYFFSKIINKSDIIIIYHDFLPPPRRGSHGNSDNTRTIIKDTLP